MSDRGSPQFTCRLHVWQLSWPEAEASRRGHARATRELGSASSVHALHWQDPSSACGPAWKGSNSSTSRSRLTQRGDDHERTDSEPAPADGGLLQTGGDAEEDLDRGSRVSLRPICCALSFA